MEFLVVQNVKKVQGVGSFHVKLKILKRSKRRKLLTGVALEMWSGLFPRIVLRLKNVTFQPVSKSVCSQQGIVVQCGIYPVTLKYVNQDGYFLYKSKPCQRSTSVCSWAVKKKKKKNTSNYYFQAVIIKKAFLSERNEVAFTALIVYCCWLAMLQNCLKLQKIIFLFAQHSPGFSVSKLFLTKSFADWFCMAKDKVTKRRV